MGKGVTFAWAQGPIFVPVLHECDTRLIGLVGRMFVYSVVYELLLYSGVFRAYGLGSPVQVVGDSHISLNKFHHVCVYRLQSG